MTEAEARTQIEMLTKSAADPVLTAGEVTHLVERSRPNWGDPFVPASVIAYGWRMKAATAAARFDFASAEQRFERSQIYKHCMQQADVWDALAKAAASGSGAVKITQPTAGLSELLP